jgi:hypothetical protein
MRTTYIQVSCSLLYVYALHVALLLHRSAHCLYEVVKVHTNASCHFLQNTVTVHFLNDHKIEDPKKKQLNMPKPIKSPEQSKKKKEVDNDKARKTIVQGTTTISTDDANKANHDKTLNASVATSINSSTQCGTTIRTAEHVDVHTCISPTHTQQVMSSDDTTLGKNQSSGKNPETQSNLFDNNIETDPARTNQPTGKNPIDPSDVDDSIDLFGNDIEPDHAGKNQSSGKTPTDPLDVNDSIDLFGNDIDPDTAGKNQPSGINHGDPSDVNDSIDLPGNDIDPDHAIEN